jgi:hypothetical protein
MSSLPRRLPVKPPPPVGHSGSGMITNVAARVLLAEEVEPDHPVCHRPGGKPKQTRLSRPVCARS